MKRYFLNNIQGRVILILLMFMTISLLTSWFVISYTSQTIISSEKEEKLLAIASLLDFSLGERTYADILIENGAESMSREEKIEVLHNELASLGEVISAQYPSIGLGYYSLELDAILTYSPASEYEHTIGIPISDDHPGRIVMKNNEAMVRIGTMVRGDIMNAMYPIARDGVVIGYAWANELASSIEKQYQTTTTSILLILLAGYVFSIWMAIVLARRSTRDINNIVQGVRLLRSDLSYTIPNAKGDLGEVINSINAMTADRLKAEEDHKARLIAEASNHAQKDFLSRMSHELRTPMNGVLGMTQLARNADTKEQRMEYIDKIHSSATLLLRIINDILDISKIEAGKMAIETSPFRVEVIMDNIRDMILPRTQEKGLEFTIVSDDSVPEMAIGDSLRISQVLLNITGNAVKFTSTGSITISCCAKELSDNKLRLEFNVRDTGIGMNEEQQKSVFTPFTQADNSTARKFGGTGLGLSISKALVELMNGEINVKSTPGQGSSFTFHVIVSLYNSSIASEKESSETVAHIRYDGLKLLLVEDNEINQIIAKETLSEMGFSVSVADNGRQGVDAFRAGEYDLIFMDIRMPIMDGIEATQEIRRIETACAESGQPIKSIPIIAMTANVMQEDRDATKNAGMNGHVSKPIDEDEIRKALEETLK
jgi:Signal transduction histidine kinase